MKNDGISPAELRRVLSRLEGFQRDAVEHAFYRLYEAPDSTRRFLVADEVGLGKTLVARGILAKALFHLRNDVERIDIIYICSNQNIAKQNLARLNVIGKDVTGSSQRITLLPLTLGDFASNSVNLISLTPSTSLDLKSSMGVSLERLLLHAMLKEHWQLKGVGALNLLQGSVTRTEDFRERARALPLHQISAQLQTLFWEALDQKVRADQEAGTEDLRTRFLALCEEFGRTRIHVPDEQLQRRAAVVGELRGILARSCIGALEPDLVILDEFQRFKHLLDEQNAAGELAHQMFNWSDDHAVCRVLLLSATPYKAYTLAHERDEDNHYEDFLQTVRFLDGDPTRHADFTQALADYRQLLYRLEDSPADRLSEIRQVIEGHLRRVMSRTERIPATASRDAMLRQTELDDVRLEARDALCYSKLRTIGMELDGGDLIDYWKSAPYPLNFMETYKVKERLRARLKEATGPDALASAIQESAPFLLPMDDMEQMREVPLDNARLRGLVSLLDAAGVWELLWVPSSLPYYQLDGAFQQASAVGFTKQLIFSAWQVVPRAIAVMLSYNAERLAFSRDRPEEQDLRGVRDRYNLMLRLTKAEGRLTGMPVLALMYPSRALSELGDPLDLSGEPGSQLASLAAVLGNIETRVEESLKAIVSLASAADRPDEAWYWAAPILLDAVGSPATYGDWWRRISLASQWSGAENNDEDAEGRPLEAWEEHVAAARAMFERKGRTLGPMPPDLAEVLALLALAGPANVTLRSLMRVVPESKKAGVLFHLDAASRVGWAFRLFFNRPESIALVRRGRTDDYWRLVLQECAAGGLPAVMDEYVHVLRDAHGMFDKSAGHACPVIADAIADALTTRVAVNDVDKFAFDSEGGVSLDRTRQRTHFAMRFGSEKQEDLQQVQRAASVRQAFNSPFWPFVLASTSIGQEGLDFHHYCHSVIHWNLPSNPVDMEQREGRVHRFKNHAVRKNVALRHGNEGRATKSGDPWHVLFEAAKHQAPPDNRGLVPCWLYPLKEGAHIQRIVPALPLSRESIRLPVMSKAIASYRLVFGQPRQDDLLSYLIDYVPSIVLNRVRDLVRIDLSPPHYAADAGLSSVPVDDEQLDELDNEPPWETEATLARNEWTEARLRYALQDLEDSGVAQRMLLVLDWASERGCLELPSGAKPNVRMMSTAGRRLASFYTSGQVYLQLQIDRYAGTKAGRDATVVRLKSLDLIDPDFWPKPDADGKTLNSLLPDMTDTQLESLLAALEPYVRSAASVPTDDG